MEKFLKSLNMHKWETNACFTSLAVILIKLDDKFGQIQSKL